MAVGFFRARPEAETETQKTQNSRINSAHAPRLTLRVGVTGHRPNKLEPDQMMPLSGNATTMLGELSKITMEYMRLKATFLPQNLQTCAL